MSVSSNELREIEHQLAQAHCILDSGTSNLVPEEWLLLATIVAEADLKLQYATDYEVDDLRDHLAEVLARLRLATNNYNHPEFLQSSRAARRRNPGLFHPGS